MEVFYLNLQQYMRKGTHNGLFLMTNQAAAPASVSSSSSSTGTSTAAAVAARAAVAAAAAAHSGGSSGARHTQRSEPSSSSAHVPPFSHGHARGSGRGASTAAEQCVRYSRLVLWDSERSSDLNRVEYYRNKQFGISTYPRRTRAPV